MSNENDDYCSSEDEDYVPEAGVEDIEDEQSGDEVDEVTAEDGTIIESSRRSMKKHKKKEKNSQSEESVTKIDASAILDMLDDEDPLLAPSKTQVTEPKPSESTPASEPSTSYSETVAEKTKIKEIFDFAGEEITIEREVSTDEAQTIEEKRSKDVEAKKPQKRAGLMGALTLLKKKPKLSVLDKSNHDWKAYKDEHNINEELATHNKGKDGYLSKVDFLTRTDYREFENEKALRNASKKL
ncbi:unnamed protein product [Auanema sp. JU1783]|nr:unnamed protein product [Auanema sp. JU1783]